MILPASPQPLNPSTIPLRGIHLIEASAGTGKTYAIETLFIRLVVEKDLTVDRILVVTFTEAATEELRGRIRNRLHKALFLASARKNALLQQRPRDARPDFEKNVSTDPLLLDLFEVIDPNLAIRRLTNALRSFDEASIYTIHSFCLRILRDNAFESGNLFDTELITDQTDLLQEIVEDFWRRQFYQISPLFINFLLTSGYKNPASFLKTIGHGKYVGQPFLDIVPNLKKIPDTAEKEQEYLKLFTLAQESWQGNYQEIKDILDGAIANKVLNANKYKSIRDWYVVLQSFFQSSIVPIRLPLSKKTNICEKLTPLQLSEGSNKGKTAPEHLFFTQCQSVLNSQIRLIQAFEQRLLALKRTLLDDAKRQLDRKKRLLNVQSFDDLLLNTYQALRRKTNVLLVERIREKYKVALIDEFQDTDSIQYEIFRIIYENNDNTLFLIGDPKQAIYNFRGADVFTYLKAYDNVKVENRYKLEINWRSEARLVKAVNELFNNKKVENSFIFDEIPFYAVHSTKSEDERTQFYLGNHSPPPLQLWFVDRQTADLPKDKPINKEWANRHIPVAVAQEILKLLNSKERARIGDKPLAAGDIAILVRTNRQARIMQKQLIESQIPSVLYSRESLFTAYEVKEVERVLLAIANPADESLIKAALTTDLFGLSGNELYDCVQNDRQWQYYLSLFQNYHDSWQTNGFIYTFRELLIHNHIAERLLSYPDGERRLTNTLHLAEVLQQAVIEQKLGINTLCNWLAQQRQQAEGKEEIEQRQLRLESDEKRVKIITIHKSKGLEYPIVFCPFLWEGHLHAREDNQITYHDQNKQLILDLGSENLITHRSRAIEEELAENLRLLYVAVTRAKQRCYLVWGMFKEARNSALSYLLHANLPEELQHSKVKGEEIKSPLPPSEMTGMDKELDDQRLWHDLQELAKRSENTLEISSFPTPTQEMPYYSISSSEKMLTARQFKGKIDKMWKISSFTSLSSFLSTDDLVEQPDHDEIVTTQLIPEIIPLDKDHIFNFPSGAKAGIFIHSLLQYIDFRHINIKVIRNQLKYHGYDVDRWETTIMQLVNNIVHTPLEVNKPEFTLSRISQKQRLDELEFHYPLAGVTPQGLQAIFATCENNPIAASLARQAAKLNFTQLKGWMKGYIDMIFEYEGKFYLVDYKSNLLDSQQAYHFSNLKEIMEKEQYFLQYYIYIVALHHYLSRRLVNYRYESHIGGVYYLFVRGMSVQYSSTYGIYYDLPDVNLIERLSNYFLHSTE